MPTYRRCLKAAYFIWATTAFAVGCSGTAIADTIQLVRDINAVHPAQSSNPSALGGLNGKLLFGATDDTGPGLWSSDGTSGGTVLLQRLTGIGISAGVSNNFLLAGSQAYFTSVTGTGTSTVWVTDGTAGGTRKVMDFPSVTSASAQLHAMSGSSLIFSANDANGVAQMYVSDGTAQGTHALTHFAGSLGGVLDTEFVVAGTKFYFVSVDNQFGRHLWSSDGSVSGTHQLSDGSPNTGVYTPQSLRLVGNFILYASGGLLWRINTTTESVSNVVSASGTPGFGPPQVTTPLAFVGLSNSVVFLGSGAVIQGFDLWRSDGTTAGTFKVATVTPHPTFTENAFPVFFKVGNHVLYIADDGTHGQQLFSSDGTAANPIALTGYLVPDANDSSNQASLLGLIGNTAYIEVTDGPGTLTSSIYRTDGTVAGTHRLGGMPSISVSEIGLIQVAGDASTVYFRLIKDLEGSGSIYKYTPASDSAALVASSLPDASIEEFIAQNGLLFYAVNDPTLGEEPWVSDGTSSGTHLLKDINPQTATSDSSPDEFVNFAGRLAFVADDGVAGRELWISDGTSGGTQLLADIAPGAAASNPNHLFVANGALYFFATDAAGTSRFMRLKTPDASIESLAALSPVPSNIGYCYYSGAVAIGSQVYFAANDGSTGLELWTSDGTAQGTHRVSDIAPGADDSLPCSLTVMGSKVYFAALGPSGNELWSSDGTTQGTMQVADIAPGVDSSSPSGLFVFNGKLYFSADDTVHGPELWTSDGTSAGTTLVADIVPGVMASYPVPVGVLNGRMLFEIYVNPFFPTPDPVQLWSTDGTPSGTAQIGASSFPSVSTPFINGNLAFLVGQNALLNEPWVTDGTAAGTHVLKDLSPAVTALPAWFDNFLGQTLFEVSDPTLGEQLWKTDGTAAGTVLIGGTHPPPATAQLSNVTRQRLTIGSTFFFAGTDRTTGTELYALSHATPSVAADTANSTDDAAVLIDVLANDAATDAAIDPTSLQITVNAAHGTAVVQAGKIQYTPNTGFAGTDTFQYTVKDSQGAESAAATVTITVTAPAAATPPSGGHGGGGTMSPSWLIALILLLLAPRTVNAHQRKRW